MKSVLLVATFAVLFTACTPDDPRPPADLHAAAEAALEAGDESEALKLWHQAADNSHAKAQHRLGSFYMDGHALPGAYRRGEIFSPDNSFAGLVRRWWYRDEDKSAYWFQRAIATWEAAAAEGDVDAAFWLSMIYGQRVYPAIAERDEERAADYGRQALEGGHPWALFWAGGKARRAGDYAAAEAHYRAAAAAGHPWAHQMWAEMYYAGEGVERDLVRYAEIRLQAVDAGIEEARESLEWDLAALREQAAKGNAEAEEVLVAFLTVRDAG